MKPQEFDRCFPAIEAAVKAFLSQWGPYANEGGRLRLPTLFNALVEPAWRAYVNTLLPRLSPSVKLIRSVRLICLPGKSGFSNLEQIVKDHVRHAIADRNLSDEQTCVFVATANTIMAALRMCAEKQPKRISFGYDSRRKAGGREFCAFCGVQTELFAAVNSLNKGEVRSMVGLSKEYCSTHKKRNQDGKQNPAYLKAFRDRDRFNEVLRKLDAHNRFEVYLKRKKSGPLSSNFYSLVMAQIDREEDCLPDSTLVPGSPDPDFEPWEYVDVAQMRNTAREIVDLGITDRDMEIIGLLHGGGSMPEIARRLNITQQSLRSTISSRRFRRIPARFRYDKSVRPFATMCGHSDGFMAPPN